MKSLILTFLPMQLKHRMAGLLAILVASFVGLTLPYSGDAAAAGTNRFTVAPATSPSSNAPFQSADSGILSAILSSGKTAGLCPLQHTTVDAAVAGYVARVSVKQEFVNTFKDKIEAVYTFPLPDSAAVNEMTMKIGDRIVRGTIKKRQEAQQIYNDAKAHGKVTSLLNQERTNIFTQSVANIEPGAKIEITIKYVDLLPYDSGSFSFVFPTVVGPRFIPGTPLSSSGTGRSPDTDVVVDASKITPPIAAERAGHDISINVHINAAVPITAISSQLHQISQQKLNDHEMKITLKNKATIPNRDFVLNWTVANNKLQSGYLTHKNGASGFFSLMLLPPQRVQQSEIAPKELLFLIDCSGSQSGAPLEKCKETMNYILEHMNANDTFQIVSFSDHLRQFPDKPQHVNADMVNRAHQFINALSANGGTWMAPAVEKVCATPADDHRLRIVTFMTDGYVGNDYEILGMVRKLRGNSRWFPFGTGNSVNRLLIDGIAREGGGEPEYVLLNSPGDVAGKKFYDRISTPVLTDIALDFHGLPVREVFPNVISDVWAEKPLYIVGSYTKAATGTVTISGFAGGKPYKKDLPLVLPDRSAKNDVLGSAWARKKVDRLMSEDYFGAQSGSVNKELQDEIVQVALEHHILSQYTSFVAVEEKRTTKDGQCQTITVPVEMPEGVSREATIGKTAPNNTRRYKGHHAATNSAALPMVSGAGNGGSSGGSLTATGSGTMNFQTAAQWMSTGHSQPAAPQARQEPQSLQKSRLDDGRLAYKAANEKKPNKQNDECIQQDKATFGKLSEKQSAVAPRTMHHKLSAGLQQLLLNQAAGVPGITSKNSWVRVSITFKNAAKLNTKQLRALSARIISISKYSLIAMVKISALKEISALSQVTLIESALE